MFFQLAQKSFGSAPELTVGQLAFFKSDVKADSSKHLKFRDSIIFGLPLGEPIFLIAYMK